MPGEGEESPRYAFLDCEDAVKWAGHEQVGARAPRAPLLREGHDTAHPAQICFKVLHEGARWEHFRVRRRRAGEQASGAALRECAAANPGTPAAPWGAAVLCGGAARARGPGRAV